jgi:enediyne biosynthesis protein E4
VVTRPRPRREGPLLAAALLAGCRPAAGPPLSAASAAPPPDPPPAFVDAASASGLRYRWRIHGPQPYDILRTIGNGCAFLDYDRDGALDILLVGTPPALYRGDGHGRFIDVSVEAGLSKLEGRFLGCAAGDCDGDGFPDLYLSAYRGGALLRNLEGRRFLDVTAGSGLKPQSWGTACTFVDVDGDGRLDLYVGNYVRFGPETQPQLCSALGALTACGPAVYSAERGALYRSTGAWQFEDVTRAWGLDRLSGKTLGAAAGPIGREHRPALALANDQVPGDLLLLDGATSRNRGVALGTAYAADGRVYGGMGADWGDYDNDGLLDLVVATFQNQAKPVFRQSAGGFRAEDADRVGMRSAVPYVSFGAQWLDYDNDGWLDLMFTNGHVQDNIAEVDVLSGPRGGAMYRQSMLLYRNLGSRRLEDRSSSLGGGADGAIVGRGLASGDYDNDGRIDALAVDSEGAPLLLHNVTPPTGAWLQVELEGRRGNRSGYGALVIVEVAGRRLTRHCHADGSYLSSSDPRVHFGLGSARRIDRLQVYWPGGKVDTLREVPVNRVMRVREGSS